MTDFEFGKKSKSSESQKNESLFISKVQDLLTQLQGDDSITSEIETSFHKLKKILANIKSEIIQVKKNDFPQVYLINEFASFQFETPSNVQLIGSFSQKTLLKSHFFIDIAVTIPSKCLEAKKDEKDYRYFDKRAIYLCHLEKELKKHNLFSDIKFSAFQGDYLKPILILHFKKERFSINLIPCVEENSFRLITMVPDHNNISFSENCYKIYNNALYEDSCFIQQFNFLHSHLSQCSALIECILLLKVWLRKREMNNSSFNGFCISMLLVHLLQIKKINRHMSSFQMLKSVFKFLATYDISKGIFMKSELSPFNSHQVQASFLSCYDVTFCDPFGVNLCSRITRDGYDELKSEAELSLQFIEENSVDSFKYLFVFPVLFSQKFDCYTIFKINQNINVNSKFYNPYYELNEKKKNVLRILKQALTDRIKFMRCSSSIPQEWDSNSTIPSPSWYLNIGLLLNFVRSRSVIDMGPAADDTEEADKFKAFWGNKAELRRFKDGRILIAVVWDVSGDIIQNIIQYILYQHFKIMKTSIRFIGNQFDKMLTLASSPTDNIPTILAVWNKLSNHIRNLKGLPLSIHSLQPISPVFRYTEVFSIRPLSKSYKRFLSPLKVILQFSSSGAWADNIEAIRKLKTAFYLELAKGLSKIRGYTCTTTRDYLDIVAENFVFRIFIYVPKEIGILEKNDQTTEQGYQMKEEFNYRPVHASAMHSFYMKYPSYGPTVRICLRWLHAHMFSDHFTLESIELLVAYLYTSPHPYFPPSNSFVGFKRFLDLLAYFDFANTPIIVNVDSTLSKEECGKMQDRLEGFRRHYPGLYNIFVASSYDKNSTMWTKYKPTKQVLQLLTFFAKQSLTILDQAFANDFKDQEESFKSLFITSTNRFDVLIQLNHSAILNYEENINCEIASPPPLPELNNKLLIGFNPVQIYLQELRKYFGKIALFFYDTHGGDLIGVIWKPLPLTLQPLRVQNSLFTLPLPEKKDENTTIQQIPNMIEILNLFQQLGEGLVQQITLL